MPLRSNDIRHSYIGIANIFRPQVTRRIPIPQKNGASRFHKKLVQYQQRSLHTTRALHHRTGEETRELLHAFKKTLGHRRKTCEFSDLWRHASTEPTTPAGLYGYLGERSDLSKGLSFATLKDSRLEHQIQIVSTPSKHNAKEMRVHEGLKSIRANTPVYVEGHVKLRNLKPKEEESLSSQDIARLEVSLSGPSARIESLNDFPSDIILKPGTEFPPEHRHLQLRNEFHLRGALELRADIQDKCRAWLHRSVQAIDIETPLLFKSTSEGAREFLVPARRPGYAYALPQSPQQFKQLLMSSGIHRYYQFAKCFRDEDLRADRQPEFTQLDMEMAFASGEDVMEAMEQKIIIPLWRSILSQDLPDPFPRMTYNQAMSQYGSDKPDLRLPIQPFTSMAHLIPMDLTSMITGLCEPIVEAMIVPLESTAAETKDFVKSFMDSAEGHHFNTNPDGGPGVFVYDSSRPLHGLAAFGFEAVENIERDIELGDGYLIILQARKKAPHSGGSTFLGTMRNEIFKAAVRDGLLPSPSWKDFKPLWVTDFPLFSPSESSEPGQGGNAGFASTHHPFTSPKMPEDVEMLLTDPTKAIGDHYDLVINGEEIGGGSKRIHQAAMQDFIFRQILKMDDEKVRDFGHLLEALRAGCPPHAGIALGFDRLVAMLASSKFERKMTMRDVIAFPKSGKGDDLMVKSPGIINDAALKVYHLKLIEDQPKPVER